MADEASADRFGAYADRATAGLARDPELRLEVRHELLTHLEESEAAHRDAGEADAAEAALRDVGDADELSQRLREANARRMRLRAAMRWAPLLVLTPVVAVALVMVWGDVRVAYENLAGVIYGRGEYHDHPERYAAVLGGLSEDQRLELLLHPGDAVPPLNEVRAREVEPVERLVERYPRDPAYASLLAVRKARMHRPGWWEPAGRVEIDWSYLYPTDEVVETIDRAIELDPANGYLWLMRAGVLIREATRVVEDKTREPRAEYSREYEVVNDGAWGEALASLRRVADAERFDDYTATLLERRRAAVGAVSSLAGLLLRHQTQEVWTALYWGIDVYAVVGRMGKMASEGDAAGAEALGALVCRALRKAALVEEGQWNSSRDLYGQYRDVLEARFRIASEAGEGDLWRRLFEERRALESATLTGRNLRDRGWRDRRERTRGLLLASAREFDVESYEAGEIARLRVAEHAVADRAGVGALASVLGVLGVGGMLLGWLAGLRGGGGDGLPKPRVLMPRAGEMVRVLLLGVALPMGLLLLYQFLASTLFAGSTAGVELTWRSLVVEYAIAGTLMLVAVQVLGGGAIRRRARDLGLREAASGRRLDWRVVLLGLMLPLAVVGFFAAVPFDEVYDLFWDRRDRMPVGVVLEIAGRVVWIYALGLGLWLALQAFEGLRRGRGEWGLMARVRLRSMAPMYLWAALLLCLVVAPALGLMERAAVNGLEGVSLAEREADAAESWAEPMRAVLEAQGP